MRLIFSRDVGKDDPEHVVTVRGTVGITVLGALPMMT